MAAQHIGQGVISYQPCVGGRGGGPDGCTAHRSGGYFLSTPCGGRGGRSRWLHSTSVRGLFPINPVWGKGGGGPDGCTAHRSGGYFLSTLCGRRGGGRKGCYDELNLFLILHFINTFLAALDGFSVPVSLCSRESFCLCLPPYLSVCLSVCLSLSLSLSLPVCISLARSFSLAHSLKKICFYQFKKKNHRYSAMSMYFFNRKIGWL